MYANGRDEEKSNSLHLHMYINGNLLPSHAELNRREIYEKRTLEMKLSRVSDARTCHMIVNANVNDSVENESDKGKIILVM